MTENTQPSRTSPAADAFGHPRGLIALVLTEMWERFSYYGMRALLVLFMAEQVAHGGMGLSDRTATAIYGIYTAAVYLVALPGGWISDRMLGAQRAVFLGGIIIMSGHFLLAIPSTYTFFLGLALVVVGTGLLKPNMSAVVGKLYQPNDRRRDSGFTIFYLGINIGAVLGPIVCGYLGQSPRFGWHYGFASAGVGMLFGLVQFWLMRGHLGNAGKYPVTTGDPGRDAQMRRRGWIAIALFLIAVAVAVGLGINGTLRFDPVRIAEQLTVLIIIMAIAYFVFILRFGRLDTVEKRCVGGILILFIGSAIFWAGYEQAGSTLNLFANRYTHLSIGSFPLLSTWFQSLDAAFVIIFAPFYAWMWVALAKRNLNPPATVKFGLGLIVLASSFLIMVGAANIVAAGDKVFPSWLFFTYLFHTLGELAVGPVGLSVTARLAPKGYGGQMMGLWFLSIALGSVMAGLIAGQFDAENVSTMPGKFMQLVAMTGGAGLIFLLLGKPLKKLTSGVG